MCSPPNSNLAETISPAVVWSNRQRHAVHVKLSCAAELEVVQCKSNNVVLHIRTVNSTSRVARIVALHHGDLQLLLNFAHGDCTRIRWHFERTEHTLRIMGTVAVSIAWVSLKATPLLCARSCVRHM
jgi:hypothetical protein